MSDPLLKIPNHHAPGCGEAQRPEGIYRNDDRVFVRSRGTVRDPMQKSAAEPVLGKGPRR